MKPCPPYTKIPREEMLYPYGTAKYGSKYVVVNRAPDSPGGSFGVFMDQDAAQQEAKRLNAYYRALCQEERGANLEASHPEPHQPHEKSGKPSHTLLWLGWLAAILLLALLR